MKVIYMNDTLCLMQANAENSQQLDELVLSGELKTFDEKPYLVTTNNEEEL